MNYGINRYTLIIKDSSFTQWKFQLSRQVMCILHNILKIRMIHLSLLTIRNIECIVFVTVSVCFRDIFWPKTYHPGDFPRDDNVVYLQDEKYLLPPAHPRLFSGLPIAIAKRRVTHPG